MVGDDLVPCGWSDAEVRIAGHSYPSTDHVPILIYPNPLNADRYLVLNSGLTFREGHDRTNSLQNPKLPDWAVVNLRQLPNALAPGRIVAAGFFDDRWTVPSANR